MGELQAVNQRKDLDSSAQLKGQSEPKAFTTVLHLAVASLHTETATLTSTPMSHQISHIMPTTADLIITTFGRQVSRRGM